MMMRKWKRKLRVWLFFISGIAVVPAFLGSSATGAVLSKRESAGAKAECDLMAAKRIESNSIQTPAAGVHKEKPSGQNLSGVEKH